MRTKICGIRSEADLRVAVDAGADAIGLICGITHVSEDEVSPDTARRLVALAPPFVSTVLVTHLEAADEILELRALQRAAAALVFGCNYIGAAEHNGRRMAAPDRQAFDAGHWEEFDLADALNPLVQDAVADGTITATLVAIVCTAFGLIEDPAQYRAEFACNAIDYGIEADNG